MPLKPGEKQKIDLKISKAYEKIKNLESLDRQIISLGGLKASLSAYIVDSPAIKKDIAVLKEKIAKELLAQKKKITELNKIKKEQMTNTLAEIAKKIAKDCSIYIDEMKKVKKPLFRGSSGPEIYMGRSWNSRDVKDSSQELQTLFDQYLMSKGIKARRGNSIFTTGNYSTASSYGDEVYLIFPKNTASYSWSQTKKDIVLNAPEFLLDDKKIAAFIKQLKPWAEKNSFDIEIYKGYNMDLLLYRLKKRGYPGVDKLSLAQFISPEKIEKVYAPTDKNFDVALKKGHEILISGEYYALEYEKFKVILPMLGIKK